MIKLYSSERFLDKNFTFTDIIFYFDTKQADKCKKKQQLKIIVFIATCEFFSLVALVNSV